MTKRVWVPFDLLKGVEALAPEGLTNRSYSESLNEWSDGWVGTVTITASCPVIDPSNLDPAMVERALDAYTKLMHSGRHSRREWIVAALVATLTVEGEGV